MWKTIQAAAQGRGHIQTQTPCQDKTFALWENGVQVIALADGAGSAPLSHLGAACVTQYICRDFAEHFDQYFQDNDGVGVKTHLLSCILDALSVLAEEQACALKDLASTLLFVAMKDGQYILGHLGDGVIGYLKENALLVASMPENGEFSNTTVFTTSANALASMKMMRGHLGEIGGFVLMSDGTAESLYHKRDHALAKAVKRLFRLCLLHPTEQMEEWLENTLVNTICQATADDCSLILSIRDDLPIQLLQDAEKADLLQLNPDLSKSKKQLQRDQVLLTFLQRERRLTEISRRVHMKPRYLHKHLQRLIDLHFIEKTETGYRALVTF